jgi:hypothetical protein
MVDRSSQGAILLYFCLLLTFFVEGQEASTVGIDKQFISGDFLRFSASR